MRSLTLLGAAGAMLLSSAVATADVVTRWNEVAIGVTRRLALNSNKSTRSLALTHLAIYDAVESVTRKYEPYLAYVTPAGPVSLDAAVATAAHDVLLWLNPTDAEEINYQLEVSLLAIPDGAEKDNGVALGRRVAADLVFARVADGSADTETYDLTIPADPDVTVNPVPGAGLWRPTPRAPVSGTEPAGLAALDPQWRSVEPFGILAQNQFRAPAPPGLTDAVYTAAYDEVKLLGAFNAPVTDPPTGRSTEQTQIANFWRVATEIPFNAIARTVATRGTRSIEENARLFALLNIALADSRIAIWETKYALGLWRPITAIRLGERDGNPDTVGDAAWRPLLETPAHPSYVSGHSATGAAGAAVLIKIFGDATSFPLTSDTLSGVVRPFTSFSSAARENADSRLYGGIHFRFDNERGLELGTALGNYVADNLLKLAPVTPPDGEGGAGGAGGAGDAGGEGGNAGEATGGSTTGGTSTGGSGASAGEAGESGTSSGGSSTGGTSGSGGDAGDAGDAGESGGGEPKPVEDDSGCDCRTSGKGGSEDGRAFAMLGAGLAFLAFRRSKRR
jgi:hypothetical protein